MCFCLPDTDHRAKLRPHLLPPDAILAAHLAPHLTAHQSQLNAKLQTVQAHNAALFGEIGAQRAELEALLAGVETLLADVDGANGLLDDLADDLAKEARGAEVEMAGT
jgi:kinetochore protein NNF1